MSEPRRLPNFIVIGAMKAGTTSLHHYLRGHERFYLPERKEINFFRDDDSLSRGLEWYSAQFKGATADQIVGEISPDYSKSPYFSGVPARISRYLPDARLIYLLRQPIDRMRSMYVHQVSMGRERRPIDVALVEDPNYLLVSKYAMQLERYLEYFSRDRLLCLTTDQLQRSPAQTCERLAAHIGISTTFEHELLQDKANAGSDRRRRGALVGALNSRESVQRLVSGLPAPVRAVARKAVTRKLTVPTSLAPETRRRIEAQLADDVSALKSYAPDVVAEWKFDTI